MPETTSTPYYGGNSPYRATKVPLVYQTFPRGRGQYVQAPGVRGVSGAGDSLGPAATTTVTLASSAASGAVVGYLASRRRDGAVRAASFVGGMAAIMDASAYYGAGSKGSAMFMGLLGLSGVGYAIYTFGKAR